MIKSKDNFLQVSDGAWIYFEDYGKDKGGSHPDPPRVSLFLQILL